MSDALPGLALSGEGRLRWWGLAVYDARLWVAPGFSAAEFASHPFVLELAYLRELKGAAIADRTIDEMQRIEPLDERVAARWRAQLRQLFPDVGNGTRLAGVHRPRGGVVFYLDGARIGEMADPAFGPRFFAIWLSARTPQPALRESLLRGAGQ